MGEREKMCYSFTSRKPWPFIKSIWPKTLFEAGRSIFPRKVTTSLSGGTLAFSISISIVSPPAATTDILLPSPSKRRKSSGVGASTTSYRTPFFTTNTSLVVDFPFLPLSAKKNNKVKNSKFIKEESLCRV